MHAWNGDIKEVQKIIEDSRMDFFGQPNKPPSSSETARFLEDLIASGKVTRYYPLFI
jgi:hypothetical protein